MIGARIKQLRKILKLTQAEFAKRMSMSLAAVQSWEHGIVEMKDASIKLLCVTYDINEDWIRTGVGDIFNKNKANSDCVLEIILQILKGLEKGLKNSGIDMDIDDKIELIRELYGIYLTYEERENTFNIANCLPLILPAILNKIK